MQAVVFCLLVLCLGLCAGQTQFTANIEFRHKFMTNGGVVTGTLQYSWNNRGYRFFFPGQDYQEIYTFNPLRGYAPPADTDRPFHNQWVYKSGRTCACETGPNDDAMAILFIDPSSSGNYTATGATRTIAGKSCAEYSRVAGSRNEVSKLWWDTAASRVCRIDFADMREITITSFTSTSAVAPAVFTPPANCKCGQPLDIAIVLDRSGSISQREFKNQKDFVVGFTANFAYGPLGANLALVHFNTPAWTTLTMTEGVSDANVQTSVNNLACCTTSKNLDSSCCCCGTSVSSGMRLGVDQLKLGRAGVEKVLITISDGYHNHDIFGNNCGQSSTKCRNDLQAATDYAKSEIPDIKMYAVGVGADRDISLDELMIMADQKSERVLRFDDFTSLATNSLDLVARACQENVNPCGGCCGFCVCGQCTAPTQCDQSAYCTPSNVSGVCCKSAPRVCNDPANLCNEYACDEAQGACIATPIACKPSTTCFAYTCMPATGLCATTKDPSCGDVSECQSDLQCEDNNACTADKCNLQSGVCEWTSTAGTCDDQNACTVDECDVSSGCRNTPVNVTDHCDDQSVCTVDTCEPGTGCVHAPVTCNDENLCTDDLCDPFKGCYSTPLLCENSGATDKDEDKCKLYFCLNGTCTSRDADGCVSNALIAVGALTTAAIIGIVVAVVLCLAGSAAGGAYAYSQAAGTGSAAPVTNNPLYSGPGNQGMNPLYNNNLS